MRKNNLKTRCEKRKLPKFNETCKTYDSISFSYADLLVERKDVKEISCNVLLEGILNNEYVSDFVCLKEDGDLMVRECVLRTHLSKPMTLKLLDESKTYWNKKGIKDWGIVINEE